MPGENVEDALDAGSVIAQSGRGIVFTKLGEAITSPGEAVAVHDHYIWLFDQIRRRDLPGHISVKPTQLGLDQSYSGCLAHLLSLARKANETGSTLWLDMESSEYVNPTLDLYAELKRNVAGVGIALQAYLYRTPEDLQRLLPLNPIIRLVKGAYNEPATAAYPKKSSTDAAYFELAGSMLEATRSGNGTPIFGTHDMNLVTRIARRASDIGLNYGQYEIHMLYGIKDREQRRLVAEGKTVKTLVSYGSAWFRWYMRRLAERPANVWFVVRSILG